MIRLCLIGVDVFPAAIILFPILLLLDKMYFHNHKKTFFYFIYSVYLASIYVVTGLPTITYFQTELYFNLIPFLDMIYDFKNVILNIILFIPLGIIMPLLWERFRNLKQIFLWSLGTTLTIEILQIFTYRTTDINDIITNVTGATIGYCITKVILKKFPNSLVNTAKTNDLYLLYSLTFIIMFFIQPIISSAIWNLIL